MTSSDLPNNTPLADKAGIPQPGAPLDVPLHTYYTIAELCDDGISVIDLDMRLAYANPAFRNMTGLGDRTLDGSLLTLCAPEERVRVQGEVIPSLLALGRWDGQVTMQRPDDTTWVAQASGFVLTGAGDGTRHIATIFRDNSARLAELRERERNAAALSISEARFQAFMNNSPIAAWITDVAGRIRYLNANYYQMFAVPPGDLIGKTIFDLYPHNIAAQLLVNIQSVAQTRMAIETIEQAPRPNGMIGDFIVYKFLSASEGDEPLIGGVAFDITERQQAEAERTRLQNEIITAQQAALRELSVPLIPLADGVVLLPLIGAIDTRRAQQIMETLLEGIADHQAATAILDITGVRVIDTQVANALLRAAHAAKLLGATVVLSGISTEVAQTIVHLGVDLGGIVTQSNLQTAIGFALGQGQAPSATTRLSRIS
jgi:rsbT co-antagonist protein RsbR